MALFQPFRALGYVADDVPFAINRRGKETFVTISVGKSWQIYNTAKLLLVFVGPQLEKRIRALACKGDLTYAASGKNIVVSRRAKVEGTWIGHTGKVNLLLTLSEYVLSIGEDARLLVWQQGMYDGPITDISLPAGATATAITHPPTYLNKVLIGTEEGQLYLYNFSSQSLIYTFKGWGCAVRCLEHTTQLDVVVIGLSDGRVVLHNIREDKQVTSFLHDAAGGAVSAVAIRDAGDNGSLLVAGGLSGHLTVWNLEEKRLHALIKDAHDSRVSALYFFPGEPLLLSAGADNSLKQWVFDEPGNTARLLKFRCGHSAPPTCISHYGAGRHILSAGQDRTFRVFSTIQDQQSKELSQGKGFTRKAKRLKIREDDLKLPRVLSLAHSETREKDWCNVITCHEGDHKAYVWHLARAALGKHILVPPHPTGSVAPVISTVAITACGNFGLVGTAAGTLHRFNMQSGLHRGAFARAASTPATSQVPRNRAPGQIGWKEEEDPSGTAHDGAVTGIACNSCNRFMVSVGFDAVLRIWDFRNRSVTGSLEIGAPANHLTMHTGSCLAAVASDDLRIQVFDVVALRRVRCYTCHTDRVTALQMSSDARWLLSSSMDGTVCVWDIPSACLIQAMRMGPAVTSLSLSPNLDLLATTHVGRLGIYLWANRPLYLGHTAAQLLTRGDKKAVDVRLPTVSDAVACKFSASVTTPTDGTGGEVVDKEEEEEEEEEEEDEDDTLVDEAELKVQEVKEDERGALPLAPQLLTLSLLPHSQWKSLMNLQTIKERNKPKAPPKKPELAPFFLPTVQNLEGTIAFDMEAGMDDAREDVPDHFSKPGGMKESTFLRLLQDGAVEGDWRGLVAHLRSSGPSAVDAEVRSMALAAPSSRELAPEDRKLLGSVLDFCQAEAATHRNFELVHSFLNLFLQVHGESVSHYDELRLRGMQLKEQLSKSWHGQGGVDQQLQELRCVMSYFASSF